MDLFQQVAAAILVLALLGAVVQVARQRGLAHFSVSARSAHPKRMTAQERLTLTPHHSLHLVVVDGRTVLVGVSPSGCQILERQPTEAQA